jgi:hypothetical protein
MKFGNSRVQMPFAPPCRVLKESNGLIWESASTGGRAEMPHEGRFARGMTH